MSQMGREDEGVAVFLDLAARGGCGGAWRVWRRSRDGPWWRACCMRLPAAMRAARSCSTVPALAQHPAALLSSRRLAVGIGAPHILQRARTHGAQPAAPARPRPPPAVKTQYCMTNDKEIKKGPRRAAAAAATSCQRGSGNHPFAIHYRRFFSVWSVPSCSATFRGFYWRGCAGEWEGGGRGV